MDRREFEANSVLDHWIKFSDIVLILSHLAEEIVTVKISEGD